MSTYQKGHRIVSVDTEKRIGVCTICGEVPVTSAGFNAYKKQYWRCRNAYPKVTDRITKPLEHYLSEINEENRSAVCAKCGMVQIVKTGIQGNGKQAWRCRNACNNKSEKMKVYHSLSQVDAENKTAQCSICGSVKITFAGFNREGNRKWHCFISTQRPKSKTRPHVHNLLSVDIKTETGVCEHCGPTKVLFRDEDGYNDGGWRCLTGFRTKYLKQKYNITPAEYDQMYQAQGGCCLICGKHHSDDLKAQRRLAVDHDHQTGKVRGLLCHNCNKGLGSFLDDPVALRKAADYIDQYNAFGTTLPALASSGPSATIYSHHEQVRFPLSQGSARTAGSKGS